MKKVISRLLVCAFLALPLLANGQANGSRIYAFPNGSQPKYEIRGKYLYEYSKGSKPVYEIR